MTITERTLWDDFLYWTSRTGHYQKRHRENPYLRPMKVTPDRLRIMTAMKQFCEERGIPARQWLYSLFAIRFWMFAPKLSISYLCSEKHIEKFNKFDNYDLYTKRIQDQMDRNYITATNMFDPNRDLSHTAEDAKRSYLANGLSDVCISKMESETFGYHPISKVCDSCLDKIKCEQILKSKVRFDIMALRRGEITAEEAYKKAIQVRGYSGN